MAGKEICGSGTRGCTGRTMTTRRQKELEFVSIGAISPLARSVRHASGDRLSSRRDAISGTQPCFGAPRLPPLDIDPGRATPGLYLSSHLRRDPRARFTRDFTAMAEMPSTSAIS